MNAFLITAAIVIATPGSDVMLAIATSLASGLRAGFAAVFGMASGYVVHAVAAGIGLAAAVASSPDALTVIEIAGACYLFGAGASQLRHRNEPAEAVTALAMPLRRGFLTSVLNPKGTVFFLAFLPGFLPADNNAGLTAFALGLAFAALTVAIYGVYALGANFARGLLSGPRVPVVLRTTAGFVFIAFACSIAKSYASFGTTWMLANMMPS